MAGKEAMLGRVVEREAVGHHVIQGAPQRVAADEAELRDGHGLIRLPVALPPVVEGEVRVLQKPWNRRGACHGHELRLKVVDGGVALHVQHDDVAREHLLPIANARVHVHVQLQAVEGDGGWG